MPAASSTAAIAWFADLSLTNIDQVGGKDASLGEMVRNLTSAGVRVPDWARSIRTTSSSSPWLVGRSARRLPGSPSQPIRRHCWNSPARRAVAQSDR
jgi:hypothetical protein